MNFYKIWSYHPAKSHIPPRIIQEYGVGWAVRSFLVSKGKDEEIMFIEQWTGEKWVTVPYKLAPTKEELDEEWRMGHLREEAA